MEVEPDRLMLLRQRAEAALKRAADPSPMTPATLDEMMHELNVYHVELEIQFEELQQTYSSLEAVKQEYASLFDFAPVGYVVTDQKGIVLNANLTACRMLGVDRPTFRGASLAEFISAESQDTYHLHRRAVLGTRQAQICEVSLRSNGTAVFPAQLTTDLSQDTLRTAISDVSLIRQAAESLRRSLAKEKELNTLQTRVLSVIAHEFRTPLTIIHSAVETLEHYADRLSDQEKKQRYQTIRNFVWYLNDMVQDVSAVGMDDVSPVLKLTSWDALDFVRQLVEDLRLLAESQPITIETRACEETEIVTWDRNLVRRILHNLLTNALKYSDKPVRFVLQCEADRISLQVSDHGPGLSDEDRQHLCEPFYRGKNSSERAHGAGLGLYVVQRAVQAMAGTLRVESSAKGTAFIVDLPRHVKPITPGQSD